MRERRLRAVGLGGWGEGLICNSRVASGVTLMVSPVVDACDIDLSYSN